MISSQAYIKAINRASLAGIPVVALLAWGNIQGGISQYNAARQSGGYVALMQAAPAAHGGVFDSIKRVAFATTAPGRFIGEIIAAGRPAVSPRDIEQRPSVG